MKAFCTFIGKHKVLEIFWIFAVALMPPLFSVWMMRHSEARTQAKLRRAMIVVTSARTQGHTPQLLPERYYLEGVGSFIGDISCRFNARSGYVRCAANPQGPCQGCRHYEEVESNKNT